MTKISPYANIKRLNKIKLYMNKPSASHNNQPVYIDELDPYFQEEAELGREMLLDMTEDIEPGALLGSVYAMSRDQELPYSDNVLRLVEASKAKVGMAGKRGSSKLINGHVGRYFKEKGIEINYSQRPVEALLDLDPQDYIDFAAWHTEDLVEAESEFYLKLPGLINELVKSHKTLESMGKIPVLPEDIFNARLKNIVVHAADIFDDKMLSEGSPLLGYHSEEGPMSDIGIAVQLVRDPSDLKQAVFHEAGHYLSGKDHVKVPGVIAAGDTGFGIITTRTGLRQKTSGANGWINEAGNEHYTQMLLMASEYNRQAEQGVGDFLAEALGKYSLADEVYIPDFTGDDMRKTSHLGSYRLNRKATGILIEPGQLAEMTSKALFHNARPSSRWPTKPVDDWLTGFNAHYGDQILPTADNYIRIKGIRDFSDELEERHASKQPHWQSLAEDLKRKSA